MQHGINSKVTHWYKAAGNNHASTQQENYSTMFTKYFRQKIILHNCTQSEMLLTFWEWSTKHYTIASTNPKLIARRNQRTNSDKCKAECINTYKEDTKTFEFITIAVKQYKYTCYTN